MRAAGHILLWVGFLAAAYCSVLRLEQSEDKWSTIPWAWYGAAMFVGIVGVVLLRRVKKDEHVDEAKTEAEYSVVRQSLDTVASVVERIAASPQYVPSEVLRCIDDECAEPLSDFADARQAMVKRFGMTVYADVMTEFASAERYINRAWSAAADGYVDEIDQSLSRACVHLMNARGLLSAAERSAA